MSKARIHRIRIWWEDFWNSDNFFVAIILRPILLWPIMLIGLALSPITALVMLLKWLYRKIPSQFKTKAAYAGISQLQLAGVNIKWWLLFLSFLIVLQQLYHHIFRYW